MKDVKSAIGTIVLRGPMQLSEMRVGRMRPGALRAFIRTRRTTEGVGERWRAVWPKTTICEWMRGKPSVQTEIWYGRFT